MSTALRVTVVVSGVALFLSLGSQPVLAGTAKASYAASLVDQTNYEHVHSEWLFTHEGDDRYGLDGDHDQARDNIKYLFESYGLTTTLEPFNAFGYTWYNVVAEIPGTTRPDEIYIVGAHYDSFSFEGPPAPGADDDASGVAAVLETARLLSKWPSEATIRFIAFDREEQGLYGSSWHAGMHGDENIRGMLSLDMIAYHKTLHNKASVLGHATSNDVKFSIAAALRDYGGLASEIGGVNDQSDHSPFEYAGFQAAFVCEYDEPINTIYHHAHDSLENPGYIDYEYALAFTRAVAGWLVDQAGVTPSHPAGDANGDYTVDEDDIRPFIRALSGRTAFESTYPTLAWSDADCNGDGTVNYGDINPFVALLNRDCAAPQVVAKLRAGDGLAWDWFGNSISVSGDTLIVGAPFTADLGWHSGSAYVYERVDGDWMPTVELHAADAAEGDSFGTSVAVSGDTLVVGARFDGDLGAAAGSAYVFERAGTEWIQTVKLLAADGAGGDRFGQAVAISGGTIVVGSPYDDDKGSNSGSAYVFEKLGGGWTQTGKLVALDGAASDNFGLAVAVSGETVLVGSYLDDAPEIDRGSVYVFEKPGGIWSQTDKLVAGDGRSGTRFGIAVALSGDTAVIGAYQSVSSGGPGSAYVFTRAGTAWNQTSKLISWNRTSGIAVAVEGTTAVVGRTGGNLTPDPAVYDTGEVYVFTEQGGLWQRVVKLHPWDGVPTDLFGGSVAVSGGTAVVGAVQDDDHGSDSGAVYVLDLAAEGVPWLPQQPSDQVVAAGGRAEFVAAASGPRTLRYQWYRDGVRLVDGGAISGAMAATLTIDPVALENVGTYTVAVTSAYGTTTSTAATLTIALPE